MINVTILAEICLGRVIHFWGMWGGGGVHLCGFNAKPISRIGIKFIVMQSVIIKSCLSAKHLPCTENTLESEDSEVGYTQATTV